MTAMETLHQLVIFTLGEQRYGRAVLGPARGAHTKRRPVALVADALVESGWLAVSPSEASKVLFPQFAAANFPGAILFQKSDVPPRTEPAWISAFCQ